MQKNYNIVELLLRYGALIHVVDTNGYKPINFAQDNQPIKMILESHKSLLVELYQKDPIKYEEYHRDMLKNRFKRMAHNITHLYGDTTKMKNLALTEQDSIL